MIYEINVKIHRGPVVKNHNPIILPGETKEDADTDTEVMVVNVKNIEKEHGDVNDYWS